MMLVFFRDLSSTFFLKKTQWNMNEGEKGLWLRGPLLIPRGKLFTYLLALNVHVPYPVFVYVYKLLILIYEVSM